MELRTTQPGDWMGSAAALPSQDLLVILQKANQIASTTDRDTLLRGMASLLMDINQAAAFALLESKIGQDELRVSFSQGMDLPPEAALALRPEIAADGPRCLVLPGLGERLVCLLPLVQNSPQRGAVVLFEAAQPQLVVSDLLVKRLGSELEKLDLISSVQRQTARMEALVTLIEQISSTLDRDTILRRIISYANDLLNTEFSSLFLVEKNGDIQLYLGSNMPEGKDNKITVPSGQGIIGHVVKSGQTVIVDDVSLDQRHYAQADRMGGVVTRSILAVPLKTRALDLGSKRGGVCERIIGGLEAMNKIGSPFTQEDARLLQALANQAATILEIAGIYNEANELFLNAISALAAAIDAKDPYTVGHSQRVSEFAVEIGRELSLNAEEIHQLRIGSLLHDIGKIGMPDAILAKPGLLTLQEDAQIRLHPEMGMRILGHIPKLRPALRAVWEHHERLDGSGYPRGLKGEQVCLAGRIVAVADVFDAITSDRPYRAAMKLKDALAELRQQAGVRLDARCVEALVRAHDSGRIQTQKERRGRVSASTLMPSRPLFP